MNHGVPARGHDPPPEPEELELPESLEIARNAIRGMESAGIRLAEDGLLDQEQDEQWGYGLEPYERLLAVAEQRAVELAENQGREG